MATFTLDTLVKLFQERNRTVNLQPETNQLYELVKVDGHEFPLFGRVMEEGSLVQLLLFFPLKIEKKALPDLSRLLHLLNRELDIPGFGLDEEAPVAFYRCMIPTFEGKLPGDILDGFLRSIQVVCKTFTPAIGAVASGQASYEDLLKKAREQLAKSAPTPKKA
jgi:hypothetical protein